MDLPKGYQQQPSSEVRRARPNKEVITHIVAKKLTAGMIQVKQVVSGFKNNTWYPQRLPWCPVLLLWCPLQISNTNLYFPPRRSHCQRKITVPLQEQNTSAVLFYFAI